MRDLVNKTGITVFGGAVAGAAAPLVVAATPTVTSFAANYGAQALTASAGSRLFAGGANATFQYIQNLPANGGGLDNLKNINLTSVGLSAINPLSIGVTSFGGTFGKTTVANGGSESVFGNDFNFKNAALNGAINYFGGKLGNGLGNYGSTYMKLSPVQANVVGNALGNAVSAPGNIIADEATKVKKQ